MHLSRPKRPASSHSSLFPSSSTDSGADASRPARDLPSRLTALLPPRLLRRARRTASPDEAAAPRQVISQELLQAIIDSRMSPKGKGKPVAGIPHTRPNDEERTLTLMNITTGTLYTAGPPVQFAQQSMSKPIAQSLAIELMGLRAYKQHIGSEASGRTYDSAETLPHRTGVPFNAHVNIGALKVWDLIISNTPDGLDPFENYLQYVRRLAGNDQLSCNEPMAQGEFSFQPASGKISANRTLLRKLQEDGALQNDPDEVLLAYCRACAVMISTADAARICGVIFNRGVAPQTEVRHMPAEVARRTATSMAVSGLYDESGKYFSDTGFQGKSGVDGGVMGALPVSNRRDIIVAAHHSDLNSAGNSGEALKWIKTLGAMNLVFPEDVATRPARRWLPRPSRLSGFPPPPPGPKIELKKSPRLLDLELRNDMTPDALKKLELKIAEATSGSVVQKTGFYLKPAQDEKSIPPDHRFLMAARDKNHILKYYSFVPDVHQLHKIVVAPRDVHEKLTRVRRPSPHITRG